MRRPKVLDSRIVNDLNSNFNYHGNHFIIFWEYYQYDFSSISYCGAFLECVLALYRLYIDCGAHRLKYCFDVQKHGRDGVLLTMQKHYNNVRNLRTYFSHNLYLSGSFDKNKYDQGTRWLENAAGSSLPFREEEWRKCYDKLVIEADEFYKLLHNRCNYSFNSIRGRILLEETYKWYSNEWPENILYSAVSGIARDYGLNWTSQETKEFINNNSANWRLEYKKEILKQSEPYDFLLSLIADDIRGI